MMSLNSVRDDVSAEKFLKNTVRDSFSHVGPLALYHSTRSSQNKNITAMNSEFCVKVFRLALWVVTFSLAIGAFSETHRVCIKCVKSLIGW